MRSIKWLIIVAGVSALALVFLGRVAADPSFNARDFRGTFAFRMVAVKSFSSDSQANTGPSSGLATAPRQDILRVGVFTATPDFVAPTTPPAPPPPPPTHGTLSGKTIATIDNNTGSTRVVVFSWTGQYGVNGNGTGVFTVEALTTAGAITCFDSANNAVASPAAAGPYPPPPPAAVAPLGGGQTCTFNDATSVEGKESYAFVIVESREKIEFIETDNGPGGGGAKIFLTGEARKQEKEKPEPPGS